jgi:exopolyphosphatase/guanosine-5'-triphosphate,3'-diphosphate pyrophosphatase
MITRDNAAPVRVAIVDLGTNSTRLLIADVDGNRVTEVVRRLTITRLGEGVDAQNVLQPAAAARVQKVLGEYRLEAEANGATRMLAVATSAVRDARNGEAFLAQIEKMHGFATRLLDGHEEAEKTFRGVTSDRTLDAHTLLVDIGGGSTELLVGGPGGVSFATSIQAGCVRLTERFLRSDPPSGDELEAAATLVRALLPALDVSAAIGVAGTITTVAAIDLGLPEYDASKIHGHRISRRASDDALAMLSALALAEREHVPGLEPARAPVIVGGLVVLHEVMERYGLAEIEASERDILHGAALAAAAEMGRDTAAVLPSPSPVALGGESAVP